MRKNTSKVNTSKTLSEKEVFAFLHSVKNADCQWFSQRLADNLHVHIICDVYGLAAGEIWELAANRIMIAYSVKSGSNIFSPYFSRVKYFDSLEAAQEFITDVACHTV